MEGAIGFIFLIGIYFLPAIIGRNKKNSTSILLLNLLLGWTIIGWIVSLVWASTVEENMNRQTAFETPKHYTCRHCGLISNENSYYCPRCLKDPEGFTKEENLNKYKSS